MTNAGLKQTILEILSGIAPEVDPAQINSQTKLREQIDMDSMDFLNFVIGLHKTFQIEIPEADYGRIETLSGCIEYIDKATQGNKPQVFQRS